MFVFECYSHNKNCLVFFLGQYFNSSNNFLTGFIQKAYQDNLTPEMVIIIYPGYLESEVNPFLSNQPTQTDLTRHKKSPVICISFDTDGIFSIKKRINDSAPLEINLAYLRDHIVQAGYNYLMSKRSKDVLAKAPAGTNFVKPSGKTFEEFIHASQLARTNYEHQFIAMSLLKYKPAIRLDCIYIDTASISAIAEAIIYYLTKFQGQSCKQIRYSSFSSYSGLEENGKPDDAKNSWVIISASASTSMGKKFVRDWYIKPEQVVTILSYEKPLATDGENIGNSVVFSVDKFSKRDAKSFSPIKVQVHGESFSVEVASPKKLLLLKKFKPNYVDKSIYAYQESQVFSVNRSGYPVHVSYSKLHSHYYFLLPEKNKLKEWIKQVVDWTVPRNLGAIIAPSTDDNDSDVLISDFKEELINSGFFFEGENAVKVVTPDRLDDIFPLESKAVLILSPAISTGRYFVDINRELRLADHSGMRVFASPFVVSPSSKQFDSLETSLKQGTNGFKYSFLSFHRIVTGSKNPTSWQKELEVVKKIINDNSESLGVDYWIQRKKTLEQEASGLGDDLGINSLGNGAKLRLAKDFVFWPEGYNKADHAAVYATVSSILQGLRDRGVDGVVLSGNVYEHCVLDPENFVRFNDTLLQSCIWRSALPSEMDYRRSDSLSNDFYRILRKILIADGTERGSISLDLLMALAIRWIKLSSDSMQKVLNDAQQYLKNDSAQCLISFLRSEFPSEN